MRLHWSSRIGKSTRTYERTVWRAKSLIAARSQVEETHRYTNESYLAQYDKPGPQATSAHHSANVRLPQFSLVRNVGGMLRFTKEVHVFIYNGLIGIPSGNPC